MPKFPANLLSWRLLCLLTVAVFLVFYNLSILRKENILESGQPVILRLQPLDPRSLMQGDYMILNFSLESDVLKEYRRGEIPERGLVVLRRAGKEHVFERLHAGEKLREGEALLEFRRFGRGVRISGGSFFFEEGQGKLYANARYAELRVDRQGRATISSLLDSRGEKLRKARPDARGDGAGQKP
ncbi:MAG: GDYXXLXY domain-containing protein [Deltaproteobacteria bacterium]|jgi:uncharacterized membrane-anchored protein|nr:GDYXXLXY domain-containing protein [Deltaproteobacteria bacterium]